MSLGMRLIVAIGALLVMMSVGLAVVEISMSSRYYLETTQRLNGSLAMYMVQTRPLFRGPELDESSFRQLASIVMSANPAVEVYLLDRRGRILASGISRNDLRRTTVGLRPIDRFLSGHFSAPLLGDDPRSATGQRIFSVAEIGRGTARVGYLYVILDGRARQSLAAQAQGLELLPSPAGVRGNLMGIKPYPCCVESRPVWRALFRPMIQAPPDGVYTTAGRLPQPRTNEVRMGSSRPRNSIRAGKARSANATRRSRRSAIGRPQTKAREIPIEIENAIESQRRELVTIVTLLHCLHSVV